MSPLPQHGRDIHLIANIITTLLDYLEGEYDAFTPVTMELPQESGIDPDYCFYIDKWEAVTGKKRINWQVDPPPDLALEVDVTSYTDVNDYLPYRVSEIWLLKGQKLGIYQLQGKEYHLHNSSIYFPKVNLQAIATDALQVAYQQNTSAAMRTFRQRFTNNDYRQVS